MRSLFEPKNNKRTPQSPPEKNDGFLAMIERKFDLRKDWNSDYERLNLTSSKQFGSAIFWVIFDKTSKLWFGYVSHVF